MIRSINYGTDVPLIGYFFIWVIISLLDCSVFAFSESGSCLLNS